MDLVRVLETYRGRDRIIRLCGYVAMFISGDRKGFMFERLRTIGGELSQCRVILRLFDDLPMLMYNLSYGCGSKEKVTSLRILNLISNFANQCFYPAEHIAWLADRKVINVSSAKWWILGIACWAISLFSEILKQLINIRETSKKLKEVKKKEYLVNEESEMGTSTESTYLKSKLLESRLALIQAASDFMNAINWCPPGILWAGKFSRSWCGFFGLISTSLMLYRNWPQKK